MDRNAIDVYRVSALGISTELHSDDYLVFCKTRCRNTNFLKWVNEAILFKSIRNRKEVFHLLPESMA